VIDFRYHIVSIIAVFLALATGLVLGASLLNTPLINGLNTANDSLVADKEDLRGQLTELQQQRDALATSIADLSPYALRDALAGQQVVMVQLPGADDATTTDVSDAVLAAGGEVTGVVSIREEWTSQADATVLDDLVVRLTQPGVEYIAGDDAYGRAATILADALVADVGASGTPAETGETVPAAPGVNDEGRRTILEGLQAGSFISTETPLAVADIAVLVAPSPPDTPDERSTQIGAAWAAIASALDDEGRAAVMVGPAAAARGDGVIAALRGDEVVAATVSTVDSVDEPIGPAVAVLALSREVAGTNGHYGLVDAADGPVPASTTPAS